MSLNFKEDSDIKLQLEKYKNRVVDLEAISKKHQESQGQLIVQNNQLKKTYRLGKEVLWQDLDLS